MTRSSCDRLKNAIYLRSKRARIGRAQPAGSRHRVKLVEQTAKLARSGIGVAGSELIRCGAKLALQRVGATGATQRKI